MIKIIVNSEQEKRELLSASEHIHNLHDIDTDIPMVNFLAHLHLNPEFIYVSVPIEKYQDII